MRNHPAWIATNRQGGFRYRVTRSILPALAMLLSLSASPLFGVAEEPAASDVVFHVSSRGSDANPGSAQSPLRTLPAAVTKTRAWRTAHADTSPGKRVSILLGTGEYILDAPLILTPEDSNLRIAAEENARPVITSCQEITGWKLVEATPGLAAVALGKVWVADVPVGTRFQTMLVNGVRATRSRSNKAFSWRDWGGMTFSFTPPAQDGRQMVTFKDKALLKDLPSNGDAEMVYMLLQWHDPGYGVITDVDASKGTAQVLTTAQPLEHWRGGQETDFRIENNVSFIGEPDEWAVNSAAGKVYYWPKSPDMSALRVQYPRLSTLISIAGDDETHTAHDIALEGLTFTGTDRARTGEKPGPNATVAIRNGVGCLVDNCAFIYNASAYDICITGDYSSHNRILHCEMGWGGGSGVRVAGDSPWEKDNHGGSNEIAFNHIHHNSNLYWNSSGINLVQTSANLIHHNYIEQCAYANISISGGIKHQLTPLVKDPAARTRLFEQMAERENLIQKNVCIEPCSYLEEGGSLYATSAQHDLYDQNLIYKSSAMPGSSVIAMDDVAEFNTITGNVIWIEGAPLNIVGMRAYTLDTKVSGNIQAGHKPGYNSRHPSATEKPDWYTKQEDLKSFTALWKQIKSEVDQAGGWPGNPQIVESIQEAKSRRHVTLTPDEVKLMHSVIE